MASAGVEQARISGSSSVAEVGRRRSQRSRDGQQRVLRQRRVPGPVLLRLPVPHLQRPGVEGPLGHAVVEVGQAERDHLGQGHAGVHRVVVAPCLRDGAGQVGHHPHPYRLPVGVRLDGDEGRDRRRLVRGHSCSSHASSCTPDEQYRPRHGSTSITSTALPSASRISNVVTTFDDRLALEKRDQRGGVQRRPPPRRGRAGGVEHRVKCGGDRLLAGQGGDPRAELDRRDDGGRGIERTQHRHLGAWRPGRGDGVHDPLGKAHRRARRQVLRPVRQDDETDLPGFALAVLIWCAAGTGRRRLRGSRAPPAARSPRGAPLGSGAGSVPMPGRGSPEPTPVPGRVPRPGWSPS